MLLAGLGRSGAGPSDADVQRMHALLATDQQADGSWKLASSTGGGNGHATGQAVFALRTAGYDRSDTVTDRGTQWLLDHQQADGSWTASFWTGGAPSAVAPSMWGAMALATYPSPLNACAAEVSRRSRARFGCDSYDVIRGSLTLARSPIG
jgi:squalene cyclase